MKKLLIFMMFTILLVGFVLASEIAPSPTCKINSQITNVTYKEAYFLENDGVSSCNINIPAKYLLKVKITTVSTVNNEGYETCEELYPINAEKTLTIYKSQITSAATFNTGKILEGDIHLSGDECESGIYLTNYATSHIEPCRTVTPGYQNECCVNKGYSGWDNEELKCIGEQERERNQEGLSGVNANREMNMNQEKRGCEAWKCTNWGACSNEIAKRTCTKLYNCTSDDSEKPKLTRNCSEKEKIKVHGKLTECPSDCTCSGSTVKCTFENGTRVMTVYAGKSGNIIVQIKDINMSTKVILYKSEDGKVYGVFKNNETKKIKMPDEIREKLQNKTRTRLYNESINLTEDGYYQVQTKKKARLFWLVPVREHMEAQVDAETGEIIKIRNPWWGFLARDVREKNNSSEEQ